MSQPILDEDDLVEMELIQEAVEGKTRLEAELNNIREQLAQAVKEQEQQIQEDENNSIGSEIEHEGSLWEIVGEVETKLIEKSKLDAGTHTVEVLLDVELLNNSSFSTRSYLMMKMRRQNKLPRWIMIVTK